MAAKKPQRRMLPVKPAAPTLMANQDTQHKGDSVNTRKKGKCITFWVTPEQKLKISAYAAEHDMSISRLIVEGLEARMAEEDAKAAEPPEVVYRDSSFEDEPEHVKLYVSDWAETLRETPSMASKVLFALIRVGGMTSAAEEQRLYATAYEKEHAADLLGIKPRTVDNVLTELKGSGIVRSLARGVYQVNPHIIGKGPWPDVEALRDAWDSADES